MNPEPVSTHDSVESEQERCLSLGWPRHPLSAERVSRRIALLLRRDIHGRLCLAKEPSEVRRRGGENGVQSGEPVPFLQLSHVSGRQLLSGPRARNCVSGLRGGGEPEEVCFLGYQLRRVAHLDCTGQESLMSSLDGFLSNQPLSKQPNKRGRSNIDLDLSLRSASALRSQRSAFPVFQMTRLFPGRRPFRATIVSPPSFAGSTRVLFEIMARAYSMACKRSTAPAYRGDL
ncbi:hypothetical protein DPEC_G00308780 [Dallia pectoralis]|uniref:Uncharacterized protein n=1 Tax=Dallia pectoralis TaxID=75939 RepID=A0ACC2FEY1_DALPE|nr:hypothetical protein DPEC_G00308780 [Dallia pectoralis]